MNLACSRLSDSGQDVKEKATRKVGGAGKRKGERACNLLFYNPLPPTFGTFEIIRFWLSDCWNVNDLLESFSNVLQDYFAPRLSLMRVRAIWRVTLCQNAACSSEYFLLQVDYALEGSTFWLCKLCNFCCLFYAERLRHTCWFSEVIFLVGMIDDLPSDERASLTSSETLSSSLQLNKGFRLFNFL